MHKLIEYVCDELKELEKKADKSGGLTQAEIEYADKLAHLKKNLLKGEMLYDELDGEEYSNRYDAMRDGNRANMGGSYARRDNRGRTNARRDSIGRYSREGGYSRGGDMEEMVESIRDIMQELPESVQRDAQRFVQKLEQEMM